MLLFALAHGLPSLSEERLVSGLRAAAAAFPQLADGSSWSARTSTGRLAVAAIHHPPAAAGPRRYLAEGDKRAAMFDGLPLDRLDGFPAHDASALLEHWEELPRRVEGQFMALRVDLAREEAEILTDSLGVCHVFLLRDGPGFVISNSIEAIAGARGELGAPDPLGVSSFASLGWAVGDRTLLEDVQLLPGGRLYRLSAAGFSEDPYFTPATLAVRSPDSGPSRDAMVDDLVRMTRVASRLEGIKRCALTAGRDTRVVLALLRACEASDVGYYTIGRQADLDVEVAAELAEEFSLPHDVWSPAAVEGVGAAELARTFVTQTDGLSSLWQVADYVDQLGPASPLGLKFWGMGGEIGRAGTGILVPFAANTPGLRHFARFQVAMLAKKLRDYGGLVTPDAIELCRQYFRDFVRERQAEGWRTREGAEAFYAWDRIARFAGAAIRRTAGTDDLFAPFCTCPFIDYSFSVSAGERFVEAPHYRILSLYPELRDWRYQDPWRSQRPARALVKASAELAGDMAKRLGSRAVQALRRPEAPAFDRDDVEMWSILWFEDHLDVHKELCLSFPDSPLWSFLDRAAVERAFAADPGVRAVHVEGLLRIVTAFWYFHGREGSPIRTGHSDGTQVAQPGGSRSG